jgi:hypothetical protein
VLPTIPISPRQEKILVEEFYEYAIAFFEIVYIKSTFQKPVTL